MQMGRTNTVTPPINRVPHNVMGRANVVTPPVNRAPQNVSV